MTPRLDTPFPTKASYIESPVMSILIEIESHVLKCLSDKSLSFGSSSSLKLDSLLSDWLSELASTNNSTDLFSVRVPFTRVPFFVAQDLLR